MARWPWPEAGHAGPFDGAGDGVVELAAQIRDGLGLHVLHPRAVRSVRGVQLVRDEVVADLFVLAEVEPAPVDDRVAPQDEANGLQIPQGKLVDRRGVYRVPSPYCRFL